jgi:hypothetical protein
MSSCRIEARLIQTIRYANFHLETTESTATELSDEVRGTLVNALDQWAQHTKASPICSTQLVC